MQVTLKNYQQEVKRTSPDLGGKVINGVHMALGITTELEEMEIGEDNNDFENIREEHGDTLWYVANLCTFYDFNFENLYNSALSFKNTDFRVHELVDLHKKELAYKKEIEIKHHQEILIRLLSKLQQVAERNIFSCLESMQININKLYSRYPDKFSEEKALNRNLEKESKVLQGNIK